MLNIMNGCAYGIRLLARGGSLMVPGLLVVLGIILGPLDSQAAIGTTTQNWPATPIYSNAAYPSAAITYNAVAGNNRLLVVGISSSTTAVAQAQPTVSYGGTAMTHAIGYSATATQQHSYLFYLPIGSSAIADTGKSINVTISGGTSKHCIVNAAVYTGVDQASPIGTTVGSSNNTTAGTAVGPFTLAVNSGELGVSVLNAVQPGTTNLNASTIALGTSGHLWTQVSTAASARMKGGALRTTFATTLNANTVTATQHTSSVATLNSTAAMTIKPIQGITVSNGSTVAGNKLVYVNDGANSINVVVDAFSMTADAPTNVTSITFTGNANTTSANVSGIKVWRKVGATLTAWEATDVQVGATVAATGGAVTISGFSEPVSTATKNYIVTYDIASGAAASSENLLTGTITAITPAAIALTDTTAFSASLYIYPTIVLGTGSEPPSARLSINSIDTRMDAFTLVHNSTTATDNDTVTNVTITMTPKYITGGSGGTQSKFKPVDGIKITDSAGTKVSTSEAVCTTTGSPDGFDTCTLVTNIPVTNSLATYYVVVATASEIIPSVADTSGTPTGYYEFTGKVTALARNSSSNKLVMGDSASQTLKIDLEVPDGPTSPTAVPGTNGGEIDVAWTAATDPNAGALHPTAPYLIRRSAPAGAYPSVKCVDGVDLATVPGVTIDYANQRVTDKGLMDTSGIRYYYRICAQDSLGNVSDGAGIYSNSQVTMVCTNAPEISLTPSQQLIKSKDSTPFTLSVTNKDQGACPDTTFALSIDPLDEVGISSHFDKVFPATVTVGTGSSGTGTPVGASADIIITGRPEAAQLETYKFKITVENATHGGAIKTAEVTGLLNDMPPIVHNAANMGMDKYGQWGQSYTCATCHSNSTTNIKGVFTIISTPIGRRNVVFTKTSSVSTDANGTFSTDQRSVRNVSNNVCSVCHHRTTQHQYSANKADLNYGNGQGVTGPNSDTAYTTDHHNSRDCVRCHTHNTAFRSITGVCGDCHGNKITGYFPVSKATMVHDKVTNALGSGDQGYGAHAPHNKVNITCGACHSVTNHGFLTTAWVGDRILEMGFEINKDTFQGFNPNVNIQGGTFYGTSFLSAPYTWFAGPGTTITPIADYNASCSTYCHGNWAGNSGSITTPIWVGGGQSACGTCHNASGGAPPASGSHIKHAATFGAGLGIACNKCHGAYANFTGAAHVNGKVAWDLSAYPGGTYNGVPASNTGAPAPTTIFSTCTNLYCHSTVQSGPDGMGAPVYKTAKWGDPSTATCGSCHVMPNDTGSHSSHENAQVSFDCHVCHDTGGTTTALNHANGTIDFKFVGLGQNTKYSGISTGSKLPRTGYGTCSTSDCHGRFTRVWGTPASALTMCDKCHGSATSPRGFYNTQGPDGTLSVYSTAIGVHDIHLQNPNSPRKATFARFTSYAKGFSCRQCHSMPDGPFKSGHIDTALPAEVPFSHVSSIANSGKTKFSYYSTPTYTSATQSCSAIWCHGAGMNSNNASGPYVGVAGSIQRQNPQWNVPYLTGNGASDCTKCHAMPPPAPDANYIHYGKTMADCKTCHTHLTNDGFGFKNKSLHVNGDIDGGCDKCHGYPPINNIVGDHEGLASPAQGALRLGTAGAHNAHVLNANIGKNCQTCHYNFSSAMPSNNLEIGFNGFNGTVTSGTFTGYSGSDVHPNWIKTNAGTTILEVTTGANVCSNLYCHGGGTAALPALGGGSNTMPNWEGGPADASCGTCHGTDTTNAPTGGSHARHALGTNGGVGMLCNACHGSSLNMTHVNGAVSWDLDRTNPVIGADATYNNISSGTITGLAPRSNGADYRTCNTVYCHSNVQGTDGPGKGAPTTYGSPRWGTDNGTLTCGSCHKNMATDLAAPASHVKHANTTQGNTNMALTCGYCHQDGGSGSLNHADNLIFVNFTAYVGGTYSNNGRVAGSAAGYGTCSSTFCHGTATSPAWGTPGPLACNACHGSKANDATWSGRHSTHYNYTTMPTTYSQTVNDLSTVDKYRFNCAHCHDDNVAKHSLKPANTSAAARVFFGISTAVPASSSKRGTYSYGTTQGTDNGFKYTNGTCNGSYCHSNGRGGAPLNTTLTWITAPAAPGANCVYCHDTKSATATPTGLSGKHDKHMNPLNNTGGNSILGTGNGFNCVDCHAPTITNINNTTIADKGKHVNAILNYSGAKALKRNYVAGSGSCSTYCHSNGNPNATIFVSMTGSKIWTGSATITNCNKCHGRSTTTGYPDYANGGASTATSNLHAGHMSGLTSTTDCADCHRKTAETAVPNRFRPYSTTHLSGAPNVVFNKTKTYIGNNANVTISGAQGWTVTCSNLVCHGQGAPVWGSQPSGAAGVRTCTKCHGTRTASDYLSNYSSALIAPGYNGEGTDTSMTKSAATDARVGAHQRHLVSNVISAPVKCGECHVVVTNVRSGNHWNYSTATLTFSGRATANAHTPTVTRTNGIISCSTTNCHTGKYNSGTTITPFWNMTGIVKETANRADAACTKCHAMPPSGYAGHAGYVVNASDTMAQIASTCGGCHTNLKGTALNVSDAFVDKTLHINGTMNYVANCDGCHAYDLTGGGTTWTPALGGGAGTGAHIKHIAFIKSRLSIVSLTPSGQTFGTGEPAAVCGTCHTNTGSQHDNGSRQITFGTGGTLNTMGAGYSGSMSLVFGGSNPSFSVADKTCSNLSCHYFTTPNWY